MAFRHAPAAPATTSSSDRIAFLRTHVFLSYLHIYFTKKKKVKSRLNHRLKSNLKKGGDIYNQISKWYWILSDIAIRA